MGNNKNGVWLDLDCSNPYCNNKVRKLKSKSIDRRIRHLYCSKECRKYGFRSPLDIIAFNVKINNNTGCWEWLKYRHRGYGKVKFNGKTRIVPRLSYSIFYPQNYNDKLNVCHKCDNPPCCNPDHLFLGTNQDNVDDRVKKQRSAMGTSVIMSKLTEDDVKEIRYLYSLNPPTKYKNHREKPYSARTLAKMFGLKSHYSILQIVKGKHWKHI